MGIKARNLTVACADQPANQHSLISAFIINIGVLVLTFQSVTRKI